MKTLMVGNVREWRMKEDIGEIEEKSKKQKGMARSWLCFRFSRILILCKRALGQSSGVCLCLFSLIWEVIGMVNLWQTAEFFSPLFGFSFA